MYGRMYYLSCSSCGVKSAENPPSRLKLLPELMCLVVFLDLWGCTQHFTEKKYTFWKVSSISRPLCDYFYQTVVPGSVEKALKRHVGEKNRHIQ